MLLHIVIREAVLDALALSIEVCSAAFKVAGALRVAKLGNIAVSIGAVLLATTVDLDFPAVQYKNSKHMIMIRTHSEECCVVVQAFYAQYTQALRPR